MKKFKRLTYEASDFFFANNQVFELDGAKFSIFFQQEFDQFLFSFFFIEWIKVEFKLPMMQFIKGLFLAIITASGITSYVQAQQAPSAAGGSANGAGGTVEFTVGQPFYTSNESVEGSVSSGVQQAYQIEEISALSDLELSVSLHAFPNPTSDQLTLLVGKASGTDLNYDLHDMGGRLLQTKRIQADRINIAMAGLPPSIYILTVKRNQTALKSFRIIKN